MRDRGIDCRCRVVVFRRRIHSSSSSIELEGFAVPIVPNGPSLIKWPWCRTRGKTNRGGITFPNAFAAKATVTRVPRSVEVTDPTWRIPRLAITLSALIHCGRFLSGRIFFFYRSMSIPNKVCPPCPPALDLALSCTGIQKEVLSDSNLSNTDFRGGVLLHLGRGTKVVRYHTLVEQVTLLSVSIVSRTVLMLSSVVALWSFHTQCQADKRATTSEFIKPGINSGNGWNFIVKGQPKSVITFLSVVCGRCLSSTRTHRPVELKRDRSAQAERDNESCFSCVQLAFSD
ncbi:hypothetical protein EVAR_41575_1 [Eumeta japonica]|uniref:Uncharacterized protein n=1 Tax=Eumeta variegata TaxID=151549 RepID=A0A4C1Y2Q4_EUMVA|nr:hypothetical protein EVAR_41575_1 [Eumeta japonica]